MYIFRDMRDFPDYNEGEADVEDWVLDRELWIGYGSGRKEAWDPNRVGD